VAIRDREVTDVDGPVIDAAMVAIPATSASCMWPQNSS
jgi:hypothetical protein